MTLRATRHEHCPAWLIAAGIAALLAGSPALAAPYPTGGQCGGFAAVPLQTAPGLCVGLVAEHLGHPRGVAVVGDAVYVADMGGWRPGRGRLLRLGQGGHGAPQAVLSGLDEPSGLLAAQDGSLYIGLLGRVSRVEISGGGATLHDVVTGLPGTGRHPLTAMAVAPDGSLYVNVGSASDHCEAGGKPPDPHASCPELAASPPRASILRIPPGRVADAAGMRPVATGLRNSMALAVTGTGTLLAGVNERDYIDRADKTLSDALLPNDTLDAVEPGADYGWPYCFDGARPNPEYAGHDCGAVHRPTLLLPPHAAPLGLLIYAGDGLPGLSGRLLIAYHGYRSAGHRLVAVPIGASGKPGGLPATLVSGWSDPSRHLPLAGLAGLAQSGAAVLMTDDDNGALLVLARR